jgi:hypothetical protein
VTARGSATPSTADQAHFRRDTENAEKFVIPAKAGIGTFLGVLGAAVVNLPAICPGRENFESQQYGGHGGGATRNRVAQSAWRAAPIREKRINRKERIENLV